MAIDFPGSPSNGQRHSHNNTTWEWDGSSWNRITIDLSTTDAATLSGIAATQFARRDDDNIITGVTTFIGNGYTGVGNTVLIVEGDARVTGVLSVGQGSVSINERDIYAVGVVTGSNFKTGTTNVHNVGVEAAGINVLGADTPIGTGATVYNSGLIVSKAGAEYQGVVTATTFKGAVEGNVTGNVSGSSGSSTGNAATATALQNARTIGGVSFDGTANINLPGVNQAGNQNTTGTAALAEGLTGTPDITVRNVTVTGIQTAEDVKNIDSIGIITARTGIDVTGGTFKADGLVGAAGSVLSSTGSGINWVSPQTGPQGAQGRQGAAGAVGAQGAAGVAGAQGHQGVQGAAGSSGGTGAQGVQGAQGRQGAQGVQGAAGAQGAQGVQGAAGAAGAQGAQGAQGRQGAVGIASLTIATSAPSSPAQGDMWWDSDDSDLHLYYNDGNSSQWVNINSGTAGVQGAVGATGAQGHQGVQGAQGRQGATGAQGHQGVQGATGAQGHQGVQGAAGAQGAQGHQGVQGAANATTINNNANNRVITGSGSANTLEAESTLLWSGNALSAYRDNATTYGPGILGHHQRGTISSPSVSQTNDTLLNIVAKGYDGDEYHDAARIDFISGGGTPGNNDMPGSILFKTTDDGQATSTTRLTIQQNGNLLLDNSSTLLIPDAIQHVGDTNTQIRFPAADTVSVETSGNEALRIASNGDVKVNSRGNTASGAPLYVAVTGKSSITYGGGQDDTACLRIVDNGSTNSYYHGIELRTKQGGDARIYAQDKGGDKVDLCFATDNSGIVERVRIDSSGHMGLGVTPSAWATNGDFRGLQVGTGAALFGRGSGDEDRGGISVNYYHTGSAEKYIGNGHAARIYMADGNIHFSNASANSSGANAAMTLTERLRIDSNGVLTTKQSSTNTTSSNWNGAAFSIQNTHDTDNNASVIWFRNSAEGCDCAIQGIHQDAAGTGGSRRGHLQFGTSGANSSGSVVERLRITSEGQLLHTRSDNTTRYDLEFINTGSISDGNYGGIHWTQGNGTTNLAAIEIAYANTGRPDIVFKNRQSGGTAISEALRINSSGYTTIPNQPSCTLYQPHAIQINTSNDNVPIGYQHVEHNDGMTVSNGGSSDSTRANSRIQVPIAGRYFISAAMSGSLNSAAAVDANDGIVWYLRKNGGNSTAHYDGMWTWDSLGSTTGMEFEINFSIVLQLAANDYLEVAYTNIHTNFNINLDKGYFSVHLLS